jgi:hypothetical protein
LVLKQNKREWDVFPIWAVLPKSVVWKVEGEVSYSRGSEKCHLFPIKNGNSISVMILIV